MPFSTLTNVNFDSPRIVGYAREAIALREALKAQCLAVDANARVDNPMADLQLVSDDLGELQRQAAEFTPNKDKAAIGENILGLRLLCLYGLKVRRPIWNTRMFSVNTTTIFMPSTIKSWRGWGPGLPI